MKIAHVVSTFPPHIGGMGEVVYEEAKRLVKKGHEVTVFTLAYSHESYTHDAKSYAFRVVRMKPLFRMGDGGETPQLFSLLKGFDVVHVHYPFYGAMEWVYCAAKLYHIPFVVTYHMDAMIDGIVKNFLQIIYDWLWGWRLLSNAKVIIGVDRTHFLGTKFGKRLLQIKKCLEINPGIDNDIFSPEAKKYFDDSHVGSDEQYLFNTSLKSKKMILYVGNIMPIKRFDILLDAFKSISEVESDAILVVIGDGVERKKYEHIVRELGLADKVFFRGAITGDPQVLSAYYANAAAVVIPSEQESFSLVLAESLSSGAVVVASDLPVIKKRIIHGYNGFLFSSGDVPDLARVLTEVLHLSDPERNALALHARASVMLQLGWDKHVEDLEEVYYNYSNV
jgi:glycosyltransferase involved in cell wall biosynthesis